MHIRATKPEERLLGLGSRNHPVYGYTNRITGIPQYICPICHVVTAFAVRIAPRSPFSSELQTKFDEHTLPKSSYEQGVSDFFCPGCGNPVRVIYSIVEHHMASYYFDVEQVLEVVTSKAKG